MLINFNTPISASRVLIPLPPNLPQPNTPSPNHKTVAFGHKPNAIMQQDFKRLNLPDVECQ